ncbi:hypothetical protein EKH77_27050 [Streptomyces luteoverticillatus]|uniref:Exonuclease domain-containing protein n=1 Tax=Streptomyces luteoverticillatus TaxID=66425 RepID=A0A3S9PPZ9_STRLT|nr:exonuclease domain-containing protein [Streptomyces luteoverticillatus]AZQ74378.1 hypothetical protein EKH77_27050 [Streptomyces luteoverticillatus]
MGHADPAARRPEPLQPVQRRCPPHHVGRGGSAPDWKATLSEVLAFADGLPLVAHNAGFDMSVVRAACTAEGLPWPELRYTCSQVIARRTWKLLSYGLPYCTDAAGIVLDNHHDADADARAAAPGPAHRCPA